MNLSGAFQPGAFQPGEFNFAPGPQQPASLPQEAQGEILVGYTKYNSLPLGATFGSALLYPSPAQPDFLDQCRASEVTKLQQKLDSALQQLADAQEELRQLAPEGSKCNLINFRGVTVERVIIDPDTGNHIAVGTGLSPSSTVNLVLNCIYIRLDETRAEVRKMQCEVTKIPDHVVDDTEQEQGHKKSLQSFLGQQKVTDAKIKEVLFLLGSLFPALKDLKDAKDEASGRAKQFGAFLGKKIGIRESESTTELKRKAEEHDTLAKDILTKLGALQTTLEIKAARHRVQALN